MKAVRAALAVVALCVIACAAFADDAVTARNIISGDEITLSDGRTLRLAGITGAGNAARDFLQANVAGHALILGDAAVDRYGRIDAVATIDGHSQTVETEMLAAGLAFVYPSTGDQARIDAMLATEQAARRERRGYWADHPDTPAADTGGLCGHYGFVAGAVIKAARVKNKFYLMLGRDGQADFAIIIAAHDLRTFKKQDVDPAALAGKTIRVRGWVMRDTLPTMTLTDPHQLEVLSSASAS